MIGYGNSSTTHDFFAYNSSNQVWNGSVFATWADGSYTSYRITATQMGTSGRFTGTLPSGAVRYELRERGATLALSYVVWTDDLTVQLKTDLIGTGSATVSSPATSTGTLGPLYIGDSYSGARAIEFTVTTTLATNGTASLLITRTTCTGTTESTTITGTATDNGSTMTLSYTTTELDTTLTPGLYEFRAMFEDGSGNTITAVIGKVQLV